MSSWRNEMRRPAAGADQDRLAAEGLGRRAPLAENVVARLGRAEERQRQRIGGVELPCHVRARRLKKRLRLGEPPRIVDADALFADQPEEPPRERAKRTRNPPGRSRGPRRRPPGKPDPKQPPCSGSFTFWRRGSQARRRSARLAARARRLRRARS